MLLTLLKKIGFKFSSNYVLADATEIIVDGDLETGAVCWVMVDGEKKPLPTGEYTLEDGSILKVEDGKVVDFMEKPAEEEAPVEEEIVEAAGTEAPGEETKPTAEPTKPAAEPVTEPAPQDELMASLVAAIKALEEEVKTLKDGVAMGKEKITTLETILTNTPSPEPKPMTNTPEKTRAENILEAVKKMKK